MSKHTPGPWEVGTYRWSKQGRNFQRPAVVAMDEDGKTLFVAPEVSTGDRTDADIRLIAAAPDLLAACEALLSALAAGNAPIHRPARVRAQQSARAAIAKAEGTQP